MTWQEFFEYLIVAFNIAFIFLMIRQNIRSWFFGGLASALGIVVFIDTRLYSEAILYSFYVIMSIYGWWIWKTKEGVLKKVFPVTEWKILRHLLWLCLSVVLSFAVGWFWAANSQASYPYFDATTMVFALLATFMEARKILSAWIYWFIINLASAWLYHLKELDVLALQMVFFAVMSIWGWWEWKKTIRDKN